MKRIIAFFLVLVLSTSAICLEAFAGDANNSGVYLGKAYNTIFSVYKTSVKAGLTWDGAGEIKVNGQVDWINSASKRYMTYSPIFQKGNHSISVTLSAPSHMANIMCGYTFVKYYIKGNYVWVREANQQYMYA